MSAQGETEAKSFRDRDAWRVLGQTLRPQLGLFILALTVAMPFAMGGALLQPYLLKRALDSVLVQRDIDALRVVVSWILVALTLEFFGRFAQLYLLQLAGQRAVAALRMRVFAHLQRLRLRYFERTPVGQVVTRGTNDVDALGEFFASGSATALTDLLMVFGMVSMMFFIDVQLTWLVLLMMPLLIPVLWSFRKFAREAYQIIREKISALNGELAEQVHGLAVVKAYQEESRLHARFDALNAEHREAHYRAIRYDSLLFSVIESVAAAVLAVVLWYAAVQVGVMEDSLQSRAYVGTVLAFYEYTQRLFVPLRDLSQKYSILQAAMAAAQRITVLLQCEEWDAPASAGMSASALVSSQAGARHDPAAETRADPAVELDRVCFSYVPGHPVLHDLSLTVPHGARIGLVGATGSGKTTVISLMQRLYEVDDGVVRVDGTDIRHISREALRARFSVIPQDVFLFAGSIGSNLHLGLDRDTVSDRALVEVLQAVGAWDLVASRGGLDAHVEAHGANWSAGERQLLAFARAMLLDRPIVMLDEATAQLDKETETRLEHAASVAMKGKTSIIIAHRLSTVRDADTIFVFDRGRIVEAGTHRTLLARPEGRYQTLWSLQHSLRTAAHASTAEQHQPEQASGAEQPLSPQAT